MNIYIEPSAKCSVRCLDCHRYFFKSDILHPFLREKNLDFEEDWLENLFDDYVINNLNLLKITGLYGDPSEHENLISFVKTIQSRLKEKSKKVILHIETHGSLQSPDWWNRLAQFIKKNFHKESIIFFAIDGINDKIHQINRKNSILSKVIKNANAVIETGLKTYCVTIEFEHTENQIKQIEKNVLDFGFTKFKVRKPRNKAILDNDADREYENIRKSLEISNEEADKREIYCSWQKRHNYWINFQGYVFRCPYHADAANVLIPKNSHAKNTDNFEIETNWKYYKSKYNTGELSLQNSSFSVIVNNQFFRDLQRSFTNKVNSSCNPKLKICAYYCGKKRQISKNSI